MLLRCQNHRVWLVLLVGLLPLPVEKTVGQQPRTRTFVYEPQGKEWLELPPPPPGTVEGDLYAIRVQINEKKCRQALSAIKIFVKKHGEDHTLYPDILIAKAEAQIGRRDYYKGHRTLQEFLNRFAGMALTSEALRLEFVIAETFLTGVKRKVWKMRLFSGEETALRILDEISSEYPDSRLAELAIKRKADHLFDKGEHAVAELDYARLLREYPRSRYQQFALRRSADAALASFGGVEYDEASLVEAEERYHDYRFRYPAAADREGVGSILDSLREARAAKDYSVGAYYERTGHLSSAVFYYQLVRKDWPDTIAATKAASRLELLGALKSASTANRSVQAVEPAETR